MENLIGDGAFLKEEKELTYEEHKNKKTKSSCERKFFKGQSVKIINKNLLDYNNVFQITEINYGNNYDIYDWYELSNGSSYIGEDLEPYIEESIAKFQEKETKSSCEEFMKFDALKPNLAILFDTGKALEDVANVMSYGAKKYNRKNWNKVDDKERYVSAPLRHIAAYCSGEKIDPESNLPHLACAITSLLFLQEIERNENGRN